MADFKTNIGKRWCAWSPSKRNFEACGYTEPGDDYKEDAIKAMEVLSEHFGEPIPNDIELEIMGTTQ